MVSMNIFRNDAFSTVQLTKGIEKLPFVPSLLDELQIFEPEPIRTRFASIEKREGHLALVKTSAIGTAPEELAKDKRDIRYFPTVRLSKSTTIYADSLTGIREFGSENELMQVQTEVARQLRRIDNDIRLTKENMRLGAVQGIVTDADGSVINNWYDEFGITVPDVIDFRLDDPSTEVSNVCKHIVRKMQRAGESAFTSVTEVHALASDEFYDALIDHPSVKQFFLNWNASEQFRNDSGNVFSTFRFGGIWWHNYRGTSDNSTVAIKPGQVSFFPVKGEDVFKVVYSPAEFSPWINTPGVEKYALSIPDLERQAWQKFELYSYPLFICTRPEMLLTGVTPISTSKKSK